MTDERQQVMMRSQDILQHEFRDPSLLELALTHASVAGHYLDSNERLEFLGDAVLGLVVCDALFHRHPTYTEGDLTRIKSEVVSRVVCARIGKELGLEELLFLSKGIDPATIPPSLLACAVESLIGAVYVDSDFETARRLVMRWLGPEIERIAEGEHERNYKSMLQQFAQREMGRTPNYELLDEKGPDHSKAFEVAVILDGRRYPSAWGLNKKDAEQKAARLALEALEVIKVSDEDEG